MTLGAARSRSLMGAAFLLLNCGGQSLSSGLNEPFSVPGAQFVVGELPGTRPLTSAEIEGGEELRKPTTNSAGTVLTYLRQGLASVPFSGFASVDAKSVAIQLEGEGTGYWLRPVGFPDAANNGDLAWSFDLHFHESAPAGQHDMLVVAMDERGRAGTQVRAGLCLNSLVPDNKNACDPSIKPPELVVGLEWDRPVDLDVSVRTPDGVVIGSGSPGNAVPDESGAVNAAADGVGVRDFDSNRDCVIDGRQREHVVWQSNPASGRYHVYVGLKNACGEAAVNYTVTLYAGVPDGDEYRLQQLSRSAGTSVAVQANASSLGTEVTEFRVP